MLTHSVPKIGKLVSIIAIAMMAFTACSTQSSNNGGNTPNQNPIKIGFSVSLSGDFSADGKALEQGYQIWADEVNKRGGLLGRQVVLDILNDGSSPNQVATNYNKLISVDKVDLIVGPVSSLLTIAGVGIAKRYGYTYVEGVGTAPSVFNAAAKDNMHALFSVSLSVKDYMSSFVNYILTLPQDQRPKTVAYVSADDPFAKPEVQEAQTKFGASGLQQVLDVTYPAETTDFAPYAQQVVASHADVLVLGSTAVTDSTSFINYFKQQKYDPKAFIAASGPDQGSSFTKAIGGAQYAEGVFVPNGNWTPTIKSFQNDQFVTDYVAKYGGAAGDISATSAESYSVVQVLEQAVNNIHSIDNTKLAAELRSGTYNSVQGPVKFDSQGANILSIPFLFQWQKGQLIPVYPASNAQANPTYPKPKIW